MAEEFDNLEFWLPSEFLTDDDILTDFKSDRLRARKIDDFSYGFGNSFGFSSNLSSPVTESDDDDVIISELTRKFSHSTLLNSSLQTKDWKMSGSPQSTLCGCKPGSRGSPNSVCGVCSPPEAEDYLRYDLLYAAAGEVARMRMIEEMAAFYSSKLLAPQAKSRPVANPNPRFYPNSAQSQSHLSYQMLQAAKFQQIKQQQMLKNGAYGRNGGEARGQGLSISAWPTLQQTRQQSGSGMRPVFLGEPATKKERTGTGVFLPKRFDSVPAEAPKKSGCSTVFLPERVVHALNFNNMDSIDSQVKHRGGSGIPKPDYYDAAALKQRNNVKMAQQQRSMMNQQVRLPQEWTY